MKRVFSTTLRTPRVMIVEMLPRSVQSGPSYDRRLTKKPFRSLRDWTKNWELYNLNGSYIVSKRCFSLR